MPFHYSKTVLPACSCLLLLAAPFRISAQNHTACPGVIINEIPAPGLFDSKRYVSDPCILVLSNGDYLASHALFGSGSGSSTSGTTYVFRSNDQGATWTKVNGGANLTGILRASLLEHDGAVYLVGANDDQSGNNVEIRKSVNNGDSWTSSAFTTGGMSTPDNAYVHNGRLWLGKGTSSYSANTTNDLTVEASWTTGVGFPTASDSWLPGTGFTAAGNFIGEGQLAVSPAQGIAVLPKVDSLPYTALARIHPTNGKVFFDPDLDFIPLPGGEKKFGTRYDAVTGKHFILCNPNLPAHYGDLSDKSLIRNTAAVMSSTDLRNWRAEKIFLYSPNVDYEGFQYLNFDFDGDDIVVASRTAFDVGGTKPARGHDSNLLTFHRIPDFRSLARNHVLRIESGTVKRYEITQHKDAPLGVFPLGTSFAGAPLTNPASFGVSGGEVYIQESGGRVLRFDPAGNFLGTAASPPGGMQAGGNLTIPVPPANEFTWAAAGNGAWPEPLNWHYWNRPGGNDTAVFGSAATANTTVSLTSASRSWYFNTNDNFNNWTVNNANNATVSGGVLSGNSSTADPQVQRLNLNFPGNEVAEVRVRLRVNAAGTVPVELYWRSWTNNTFAAARKVSGNYTGNNSFQDLVFSMAGRADWAGQQIVGLRLDPVQAAGIVFEIDSIEVPQAADRTRLAGLRFRNPFSYTLGGNGSLQIQPDAGDGLVDVQQGNHTIALPLDLGINATASVTDNSTLRISGILSGAGNVTLAKEGNGTLSLSGNSTFAGTAEARSGTLALAHADALSAGILNTGSPGAQAVAFTVNGTNTYNLGGLAGTDELALGSNTVSVGGNNAASTFTGVISGAGGLAKTGSSTLTLGGVNTYNGPTTIAQGAVLLNNNTATLGSTAAGTVVQNGAQLRLTANNFLLQENLTLSGPGTATTGAGNGALGMQVNTGNFVINGTLTLDGGATIGSYNSNTATLTLARGIGGTGDLTLRPGSNNNGRANYHLLGQSSYSGNTVFSTANVSGTATIRNGIDNALPTGSVLFMNGTAGSANTTLTYVLNGFNQTVAGLEGTNGVSGNLTYVNSITGGNALISTLTVNNTADFAFNGTLGGNGTNDNNLALVKSGSGTLALGESNTFIGTAEARGGTLVLGHSGGTLADTSTLALNGGTVQADYDDTIGTFRRILAGAVTGAGQITSSAYDFAHPNGTATLGQDGVGTEVIWSGPLIKSGNSTLVINDTPSYIGGTFINAGILQVGSGSTTGVLTGDVTNNGILRFNRSDNLTFSGVISGTGTLEQSGAGALILTADNIYTGETTISAGTLQVGNGSTTGSLTGNITNHGTLLVIRSTDVTFAGVISGSGMLLKSGGGDLILTGVNTFTGGLTNAGTGEIKAGSDTALGTGTVTLTSSGGFVGSSTDVVLANDLQFNNSAASAWNMGSSSLTFTGNVSGTGNLNYNGFSSGTLGFSGNNTGWSGNITATGGAQLRLGHANALGTGNLLLGTAITGLNLPSISSSAALSGGDGVANNIVNNVAGTVFYLDHDLKLSGNISGPGSVRLGTGSNATLILAANNTYTGFTNLQEGALRAVALGNGGAAGNIGAASSAAINLVFSNGTLQYTGPGESTDRLFTIGSAASAYAATGTPTVDLNATVTARIDASGSGPLVFASTGSLIVGNALNNVLELTGNHTGNNTLAAAIGDSTDDTAVVLNNCTTTSGTNGNPNRQVIVSDTTGILVGDSVAGGGINGTTTVTAVLGPTRLAIVPGTNLTLANATLTFTPPDVSLNKTALLKSGPGTWVLTGANAYTGNTTVTAGVLSLSGGSAVADANTLIITGGKVNLASNEAVGSLVLGNATQGNNTYGSTSSSAAVKNDTYFSGTGVLTVGDGGTPPPLTFATWASGQGLAGGLNDNFDGDKFTDGEEYAYDLDPLVDESGNVLASQTILSNGNITLTLAFSGNSARSDINYMVRRSATPSFTGNTVVGHWNGTANWTTSNATYFANQTQSGAGDVKAINVNLSIPAASEPRQFLKVDIE